MAKLSQRFRRVWNAFFNKDPTLEFRDRNGWISTYRPDRVRLTRGNERSIITSVLNRIALDCAAIDVKHVRLDEAGRYSATIEDNLNECLTLSSNRDQTARAFWLDVYMSLLDEGCVALVPVEADFNPIETESYDISKIRVAKVIDWRATTVKVEVYNEDTCQKEQLVLPKDMLCIVENPLYAVMNEPNSMLQRLIRKLNLLDVIDEQSGAGKLDLIIQFPFTVNTDRQKQRADQRRAEIERQLAGSKYGIAYTDGAEHITQLNRAVENNLMGQIEYLMNMVFSQLGMSQSVFDGTADEQTMLNYYNRTIEPIISSITDEMNRKWLTKTARTQGQAIRFFRDPFRLVPTAQLAELADKFTRNEIMTSNEIRQIVGMKPADDPRADQLINSNLSQSNEDPRVQEVMSKAIDDASVEDNNKEADHDVE